MNTWNEVLEMDTLHVGILGEGASVSVYFTEEETVEEAVENGSCVVVVMLDTHGLYEPWARLQLTKSDMLINLRDYPEYYEKFTKWASKIVAEEVGA